jgi:4a-hydroxytetrahydrobiopterin dehydratase
MAPKRLTEDQIVVQLKRLKGWSRSGPKIRKVIESADFVHAMGLVNSIALIAQRINHHPEIEIRWNKVTLVLSTHSAGGLTKNDFKLARSIDEL